MRFSFGLENEQLKCQMYCVHEIRLDLLRCVCSFFVFFFFGFLVNKLLFVVSEIWTNNKTEAEECKSTYLAFKARLQNLSFCVWDSPYRRKCNCCAHAGTFETPTTMQCIWQTITRIRCQCSIERLSTEQIQFKVILTQLQCYVLLMLSNNSNHNTIQQ